MKSQAICTIIAKNYVAFARTLARSLQLYNPGVPFYALIVDDVDSFLDASTEPFKVVTLHELKIPELSSFCFKYDVLELATAAKPYLLGYLFDEKSLDRVLYLDPDILVTHPLDVLFDRLDEADILLTPHLDTDYPDDGLYPDDAHILRSGIFNLGFIGVSARARAFLLWWQLKVYHNCVVDPTKGYFTDQRFIDLASTLFSNISVVRDVGFNVAYWNLHSRWLSRKGSAWQCNGGPLYFFHFSGYELEKSDRISKYITRFNLTNRPDLRALFDDYRAQLLRDGHWESRSWPYTHGYFKSGQRVPGEVRKYYWRDRKRWQRYGDPFASAELEQLATEAGARRSKVATHGGRFATLTSFLYQRAIRPLEPGAIWLLRRLLPQQGRTVRRLRAMRAQLRTGVNVTGYFASEKGVGEAARATLRALQAAGIPHVVKEVVDGRSANEETDANHSVRGNPYAVNLLHVNADQVPRVASFHGHAYFRHHYNVGFWFWELSDFPHEWRRSFDYLQEIWVASDFVHEAVARVSPIPVTKIPLAISEFLPQPSRRADFDLPDDVFLFLFMFDYHSVVERKNPLGLVRAFQRAFGDEKDVLLVLKSSHGDSSLEAAEVKKAVGRSRNIRLLDTILPGEKVRQLLAVSDSYIALHRSEGFGLPIAEAMALAKPVIATAYSGNMDFMNATNSLPVNYRLVEIGRDYGPYRSRYTWADPDLDHAAALMRQLREDRPFAEELGLRAQKDIINAYSAPVVGARIAQRLARIMSTDPL